MNETLSLLVRLQKADTDIHGYETLIKSIPVQVEEWRKQYQTQEAKLAQMNQQVETLNKELRHQERELKQAEDETGKLNAKIYAVKSQKEMVSLDHEITKNRQTISQIEDKILELMNNIEILSDKIEAEKKNLSTELSELSSAEKDCQIRLNQTQNLLKTAKEEKDGLVNQLPPEIVARYEKLLVNKNNLAVVRLSGGACQGCFTILPPQIINEVKSNSSLINCERCLRILYYEAE